MDYLCHENFLIRYDYISSRWSKFGRTGKPHPITTIDETIAASQNITKPITMTMEGGKYAYHEEDGFYPVLL